MNISLLFHIPTATNVTPKGDGATLQIPKLIAPLIVAITPAFRII